MIKQKAKRNHRQRKKLKVDEYRQWAFFVNFNYAKSKTALDIDSDILDTLYEIAEKNNCWMMGFVGGCSADMTFHNKRLLDDGVRCQLQMANWLMKQDGVSDIKVGFKESVE